MRVTKNDVRDSITEVREKSWEINYNGAECRFESDDTESAVISHVYVPEDMRNNNIGTAMLQIAEQTVKNETNAEWLYLQIGAPTDATEHVVSEKLGYTILGTMEKETLGKVIDAQKQL